MSQAFADWQAASAVQAIPLRGGRTEEVETDDVAHPTMGPMDRPKRSEAAGQGVPASGDALCERAHAISLAPPL